MSEMLLPSLHSHVRLVNSVTADMSEMLLSPLHTHLSLVNPAIADMSEMGFPRNVAITTPPLAKYPKYCYLLGFSPVSLVNRATADMSEMRLLSSIRVSSLVNPATGEISEMRLLQASSHFRFVANSSRSNRLCWHGCYKTGQIC